MEGDYSEIVFTGYNGAVTHLNFSDAAPGRPPMLPVDRPTPMCTLIALSGLRGL